MFFNKGFQIFHSEKSPAADLNDHRPPALINQIA